VVGWLRRHDRGFAALRRAGRTAIVMPLLFALGVEVLEDAAVATFAAFGSFAMLLLVDFGGPLRDRLRNQAALAVACAGLIAVATLVSSSAWPAAVATGVVGFGILFAGVASSVLASATQPLLLSFILSVCLPGPASSIPERLAGWGLASGCSLVAIALLWPAPARDPVRTAAIAAVRALAGKLRGGGDAGAAAQADADAALAALEATFYATPFRPTGLSTAARSVIRLVDELRWLAAIAATPVADDDPGRACAEPLVAASADVLDAAAAVVDDPADGPARAALDAAREALRAELDALERSVTATLLGRPVISAASPGFRAQELAYITLQVAANAEAAAAADRRSWAGRLLGRRPAGAGPLAAAQERTGAHLTRSSVWLRNSVRGGIGLAGAVLVAELSSTQHAFWVVLGALSVLRSNALTTGETIARAIGGTAVGLVVGGTLVWLIGTNHALLWALLPLVILAAGLAPTAVSFAAGQAAFTLTVLIIFNILEPAGWRLGLVRFEDVALGCGVSLLVGLLLWPRGAGAVLGRALSAAYRDSAAYLSAAVAYGVGRCDARVTGARRPDAEAARAAAASRRLDDAFRGYLGERGDKPVPMADVTRLVTGVVGLRLAADAVLDLWDGDGAHQADRAAVRAELEASGGRMAGWYDALAASLEHGGAVPAPLGADADADGRLVAAAQRDLASGDPLVASTAVRVLWTGDHLDAARRLEAVVAEPARQFAEAVV
jgi:uncharacterized membrane protein YccC